MDEADRRRLDDIVRPFDVFSDHGRRSAYQAVANHLRYSRMADARANAFMLAAARWLGFPPITVEELRRRDWRVPFSGTFLKPAPEGTTFAIVWSPEVLEPEEYQLVVRALGDLARVHGAAGVARLMEQPASFVREPAVGVPR